jgi:hypothetical protein
MDWLRENWHLRPVRNNTDVVADFYECALVVPFVPSLFFKETLDSRTEFLQRILLFLPSTVGFYVEYAALLPNSLGELLEFERKYKHTPHH